MDGKKKNGSFCRFQLGFFVQKNSKRYGKHVNEDHGAEGIKQGVEQSLPHYFILKDTDKIFESHEAVFVIDTIEIRHAVHDCFQQRNDGKRGEGYQCR